MDKRRESTVIGKAQEAPNMIAILQWCRIYRPDILGMINDIIDCSNDRSDAFSLLLAVAFEAGRNFQYTNPDCILGAIPPGNWEPVTDTN